MAAVDATSGANAFRVTVAPDFAGATLLDLLVLEEVERDIFRAGLVFRDARPLYGGQVAAQALYAAGLTVPADRMPHSLHGYFLRGGDGRKPTVFRVHRDRDGRSHSARRVVAIQNGQAIFTVAASFVSPQAGSDVSPQAGSDHEFAPSPAVPAPAELPVLLLPWLASVEGRLPAQPYPEAEWPTRFWARCAVELPESPLVHACALTYLSDSGTGLSMLHDGIAVSGPSLDHAVWFHRPAKLDDWVLVDLAPRSVAAGRGLYSGSVHGADGTLVASVTQECLFRPVRAATVG